MKQFFMMITAMLLTCCSSGNSIMAEEPVLVETQNFNTINAMKQKLYLKIDGVTKTATLVSNSSTEALVTQLQQGDISSGG